ncbi:hypothetical protein FJ366_00915 [Candidatus Dependentiae bacterium]|nr:hypothetical protein [Candidatus Dependentiae bacterium]
MRENNAPFRPSRSVFFFFFLFIIDQITKRCALLFWSENIIALKSWLFLGLEANNGLAWGIGASSAPIMRWIFSLGMFIGLIFLSYKTLLDWCKYSSKWIIYGRSLIIVGGFSNLVDRLFHGAVIDFIQLFIGNYRLSVFNLADVYIIVGICILLKKASHEFPF